ncbi:hypothetical protein AAGQ96_12865 [Pantoea sp. MBD-2R]
MRVDFADGADIHHVSVFAVGVDRAKQRAAGISYSRGVTLAD